MDAYGHSEAMLGILTALAWVLGISFGSFVTMLSYRLPRGEAFVMGHSHCPSCHKVLTARDLVPVFSWLFSGGKCSGCKSKVSIRYPLTEIVCGFLFAIVFVRYGITLHTLVLWLVATTLMTLVVIDLEHYLLPDSLNLFLFVLGLVWLFINDAPLSQYFIGPLIGLLVGTSLRGLMWVWKKQEGLGMGDVKFLVVSGLFLPPELIITFLFLSGVIGVITAVFWQLAGRGERFPFGPALAASLMVLLVMPELEQMFRSALVWMMIGKAS